MSAGSKSSKRCLMSLFHVIFARANARELGARTTAPQRLKRSESERRSVGRVRLDAEQRELRKRVCRLASRGRDRKRGGAGDRSRCATGRARAAVRILAAVIALFGFGIGGMRMGGVIVSVRAVLPVLAAAAILVVPVRHALARCDSGHALRGDG